MWHLQGSGFNEQQPSSAVVLHLALKIDSCHRPLLARCAKDARKGAFQFCAKFIQNWDYYCKTG